MFSNGNRRNPQKPKPSEFVEAKLPLDHFPNDVAQYKNQIEISTPDGFVIKLPGGSNSTLLFAILQALRCTGNLKIYFCSRPTDMRMTFDGLSGQVRSFMGSDLSQGIFLFS